MTSFRERVSSIYYTHGLFCSSHPLAVFALTFSFVFLCCYPLSKLPFPGNAPLQHSTPLDDYTPPDDVTTPPLVAKETEQRPIWYSGPSAGFVLQIVVKATVSPWQRTILYPGDAFRSPLLKAFDILDTVNSVQLKKGNSSEDISELCFQVSETLADRGVRNLLPQYNCLVVSPANMWELDRNKFNNDGELVKTVYKVAHSIDKSPLLKDILFGVAWAESGMSRFYVRNRQRVISFAITIILKRYDKAYMELLQNTLHDQYPLYRENLTGVQTMTHVYFKARNYFFLEHTPLIVAYVVLFLYIYFSVRKIEMVKSKWGLALASVATVIASLFMSVGICTFFGLQPILLGARIYEIFPYLVVIVGLENVLILTKSVVSTPVHMDVKYRIAEGLYKEGWGITKNLVYELLILLVGFFTFVPEIQEFCLFACVGLLSDFFLQIMFFITVLSIDIRRMELTDLKTQSSVANATSEIKHPQPIINCPYRHISSGARRLERSRSFPHADTVRDNTYTTTTPKRLQLIEYLARYRMLQRLLMLATAVWIALILYQTGLAAHTFYVSLNETDTADSHRDVNSVIPDERAEDLELMLGHDSVEHWTKLSNAHWPTLFGFYNVSLWNRYLTVLPPIHLSIPIHPDSVLKYRHPEETKSKLDWLPPAPQTGDWLPGSNWFPNPDWLPPVPDYSPDNPTKVLMMQAKRFYPRTKREFYVTLGLAIASAVIIAYLMVALYGCMCSRNYSKWRSEWRDSRVRRRRTFSDGKSFAPGVSVPLIGHRQSVECVTCNGQLVMTSCLAGEIRVWDSTSGDCITVIPSVVSQQPVHSHREQLYDPHDIDTDFTSAHSPPVKQNVNPVTGYDFTMFAKSKEGRRRSKTVIERREPQEVRLRSQSADSPATPTSIDPSLRPGSHSPRRSQIWCLTCQDSLIAAGCSDGRVELWECTTGDLKCQYQPSNQGYSHSNMGVTHLILCGSRLIIARLNGFLDFLLLETYVSASVAGSSSQKIYMRGHLRKSSGTWRRDGHVFGVNDLVTCSLVQSYRAHSRSLSSLCCEGGRVVTASLDTSIKVYKLDDCMCLYTLHGHQAPVTALCLDEQSPLGAVTGCTEGVVLVWDLLTGACVHKLTRESTHGIISVVCTPVYVLSTCSNHDLCVWERCRGLLLHTIRLDYVTTDSLAMLTSHLMVCATRNGCLQVWDVSKPSMVHDITLSAHKPPHTVLTVGNSMVICDLGNQVKVIPFPSGMGKVE